MRRIGFIVLGLGALLVLVALAPAYAFRDVATYLPLHSFLETVAIVIAALVFSVVWNTYSAGRSGRVMILACALLGAALIDFGHLLSYAGMPAFVTPAGAEKAIFFWLAARLLVAGALLAVSLRAPGPLRLPLARYGMLGGSLGAALLVFWVGLFHADVLPRTFVEGSGLTPAKIAAEYLIIGLLASAAGLLYREARSSGSAQAANLCAAAAVSILSELCFTLYADVTDAFNLLGHLYKTVAYGYVYRAAFVESVREPFERLRARERRLARTERIAHIGGWEADLAANRIVYSEEALRIHGLGPEAAECTIEGAILLAHPEDRQKLTSAIHRTLYAGEPFSLDYRIARPDGSVRHVHVEDEVVRDAAGAPVRAFGITQDITERRAAEQALREEQQRLGLLTDNVPAMIAYVDAARRYLYANLRYRLFYNGSGESIEGRKLDEILPPDTWVTVGPQVERALAGEAPPAGRHGAQRLRIARSPPRRSDGRGAGNLHPRDRRHRAAPGRDGGQGKGGRPAPRAGDGAAGSRRRRPGRHP